MIKCHVNWNGKTIIGNYKKNDALSLRCEYWTISVNGEKTEFMTDLIIFSNVLAVRNTLSAQQVTKSNLDWIKNEKNAMHVACVNSVAT